MTTMRAPDRKRRAKKAALECLAEIQTTVCFPPKNERTRKALAAMVKLAAIPKPAREDKLIAMLYVAAQRSGWEKGPTLNEAINAANDWYYNKYGYEGPPASVALRKMGGGEA